MRRDGTDDRGKRTGRGTGDEKDEVLCQVRRRRDSKLNECAEGENTIFKRKW